MNYYQEIDAALKSYEEFKPYHPHKIEWITDRIWWCWKWKKITQKQMEELAIRATNILENNLL